MKGANLAGWDGEYFDGLDGLPCLKDMINYAATPRSGKHVRPLESGREFMPM